MQKRSSGFTLLEILVVVAVIGILAAIAIMNGLNALTRARQKATMADMRAIAVAWEARAVDLKRYNAAAAGFTIPAAVVPYVDLQSALTPTYIRALPQRDGWGTDFLFHTDKPFGEADAADDYCIRSAGRDAQFETSYTPGTTEDPKADIVYSNGTFIQSPVFPK